MPGPRIAPGWALAILRIATLPYRLPFLTVALADATRAVVAEAKMRHIELRHRDADEIATLTADHLAVRHVLAKVFADPAADNLPKTALIPLNFHDHLIE